MNIKLIHDKNTDVAFIDVCDTPNNSHITVVDVSDQLGLKSLVQARVDENGNLLGLMIEDYSAFRREVRRKYVSLAVDRIINLIVTTVKGMVASGTDMHQLAPC